ncbi:MAG: TIGR03759 family integrating conjugative element protein [Chromatiaceae bacterium]|nr:TIGR03759 family integrating conjugative element protein [Chromatiaceae bacterium]
MMRLPIIIAFGLAAATTPVAAADTRVRLTDKRPLEQVESAHTRDQLTKAWGLTAQEVERYEILMRGPRGAFSVTNISPIEVLGIHAETPAERQHYADRFVRLLYEDTERVLAFERATQAAWRRLGKPMFEAARLPGASAPLSSNRDQLWGKRLALFVATQDCPRCAKSARELVDLVADGGPLSGLDIYAVDTQDPDAIRTFARDVGVLPGAVSDRRVTLNQGKALFQQYDGDDRGLPQVFVRDGTQLRPLDTVAGTLR